MLRRLCLPEIPSGRRTAFSGFSEGVRVFPCPVYGQAHASLQIHERARFCTIHLRAMQRVVVPCPQFMYHRRKGRDLFDLWLCLSRGLLDPDQVVGCFAAYMKHEYIGFRAPSLRATCSRKRTTGSSWTTSDPCSPQGSTTTPKSPPPSSARDSSVGRPGSRGEGRRRPVPRRNAADQG